MMQSFVIMKGGKENDNFNYCSSGNIGFVGCISNITDRMYPDTICIGRYRTWRSSNICTICDSPLYKEGPHKEKRQRVTNLGVEIYSLIIF